MELATESLLQFYERTKQQAPADLLANGSVSHFIVKPRTYLNRCTPYNRRDYYKICLIKGKGIYKYDGKAVQVDGSIVSFSCPTRPSSWESTTEKQEGYYCLFNDAFLLNTIRQEVRYQSPLFNESLYAVLKLDKQALEKFSRYFADMESLLESNYIYKFDMIRSILQMLILEGVRLQNNDVTKYITTDRTVSRFFELLNRQFPVDSPENPLQLVTPASYATQLNVHVNHLNNMVKKSTGKTTSEVIRERVIAEAKALLVNTAWDAAEIAYSLGFEYPSHFNKYFKQHSGSTPLLFREQARTVVA
ncbi:MAG: AraC family transcriptional regulator [Filimonas sp.]|nr:AraC family transcriptional regulator [Filimonas sp.]